MKERFSEVQQIVSSLSKTLDTSCVRMASKLYTPVRVKPEYMRGKREGAGKKLKALSKMADNREKEVTFCCVG